jgi:endonuclease/exonuclease/phosphatase (EEP) superfamily protein YafD
VLLSRLPLVDPKIRFLVQDDIPSIHTGVELRSGDRIFLHGLHPRPPEPIRDQDSTPRDAELVVVGKAIRENGPRPTIVAGDLNDVAWSETSELFLRLSGLLDPRMGRGFYNSYHADHWIMRYPLDHVFHSNHFRLIELQRLPHIGSDHFPMLVELNYEPEAEHAQEPTREKTGDETKANEVLVSEAETARTGDDQPRDA